jgi:hypothetical protein
MEILLFVEMVVVCLFLAFLAYRFSHGDETRPRRLARILIPVDEKRRRRLPQAYQEEEVETQPALLWLVGAMVLVLFLIGVIGNIIA